MYIFIVNPNARSGRGYKVWEEIELILQKRCIHYQVYFTKYQTHASKLVQKLTLEREKTTLIILGGDGTINEVINGIIDFSKVILGYIPIGSSNDFARGLGLSCDYRKALDNILTPSEYVSINIGVLNKNRRFAVSTGLGFDAAVCHQVAVSKMKVWLNKIGLGKLSYLGVALQLLLSLSPKHMTVKLDGWKNLEFEKVYFAAVMNQKFEGGGFKFCPKADPCDDILDVIIASDISKLKVLCLLPTAFKGLHIHVKGIHIFRCREAELLSEITLPVHTDGEPVLAQSRIFASLEKDRLRFIVS